MNKKKTVVLILMVFIAVLLGGCSEKSATIGVVDMQKIMTATPKMKQMQEQLNVKGKDLMARLEKDKATLPEEEYKKSEEAAYAEFMTMKQAFEVELDTSVKKAIEEVAKEKKLGAVVHKQGMAWGGVDVTDEVLSKLQ